MGTDFSTFKNMTPQRRLQELQKLIDSLKREIEDRQNEIRTAEQMLSLADEEARLLEQVEVPEAKLIPARGRAREIEERVEEKPERGRLTREERTELEKLLATAPPRSAELLHRAAHLSAAELYKEGKGIYERQKETGIETQQDREKIYAIRKAIEIKKEEGYNQNQNVMTAAQQIAETVYKGGAGTYKRGPT